MTTTSAIFYHSQIHNFPICSFLQVYELQIKLHISNVFTFLKSADILLLVFICIVLYLYYQPAELEVIPSGLQISY